MPLSNHSSLSNACTKGSHAIISLTCYQSLTLQEVDLEPVLWRNLDYVVNEEQSILPPCHQCQIISYLCQDRRHDPWIVIEDPPCCAVLVERLHELQVAQAKAVHAHRSPLLHTEPILDYTQQSSLPHHHKISSPPYAIPCLAPICHPVIVQHARHMLACFDECRPRSAGVCI